jgi:hypothetical protein
VLRTGEVQRRTISAPIELSFLQYGSDLSRPPRDCQITGSGIVRPPSCSVGYVATVG